MLVVSYETLLDFELFYYYYIIITLLLHDLDVLKVGNVISFFAFDTVDSYFHYLAFEFLFKLC